MTAGAGIRQTTLVLGGARSGKSRYAEELVESGGRGLYLATAAHNPADPEMVDRIARHRQRRGDLWITIEEPLEIPDILLSHGQADRPILVDCLTLWLSNLMFAGRDIGLATADLLAALDATDGPVVLVSNEVGLGIVPDTALARTFRDHAGRLHQAVAAACDRVVFMAAGLPLMMKDEN